MVVVNHLVQWLASTLAWRRGENAYVGGVAERKGDVAAVKAAIDAGREKVEGLGKLIAAHVIPRPSTAVLSLLPKT